MMGIYSSPFEILSKDPVQVDMLSLKSSLMVVISEIIRKKCWTQKEASQVLMVSQPRISNLVNGRIDKFSIDMLLEILARAGFTIDSSVCDDSSEEPISLKIRKEKAVAATTA